MQIKGTVVYQNISGGFWGLLGDDGRKYAPVELPAAFRKDGLRVLVQAEPAKVMSVAMWGMDVEVKHIEAQP